MQVDKFGWHDLAYALIYPILMVVWGRIGLEKIEKLMKNMMRFVLDKGFSWLR